MRTKATYIAQFVIRVFLMVFWLYVALDKLWDLPAFRRALLRQPFPDRWAEMLFWSLPLLELAIALGFLVSGKKCVKTPPTQKHSFRHLANLGLSTPLPYLLSTVLLFVFTLYIGLGVAGIYAQKPCGCASVFHSLSWEQHLLANIVLCSLSILGWYLTGPTSPMDNHRTGRKRSIRLFRALAKLGRATAPVASTAFSNRFPRKFAPFPALAGACKTQMRRLPCQRENHLFCRQILF